MKRHLSFALFVWFATTNSCRVVPGDINRDSNNDADMMDYNVQSQILPALRSVTSSIQTVGVVFKATKKLSGDGSSEPGEAKLIDGANIFEPSTEDELRYTRRAGLAATNNASDNPGGTYDFVYKLAGRHSGTIKDPSVFVSVEVKGVFKVINGAVSIAELKVEAKGSNIPSDADARLATSFEIATLVSAQEGTVNYHVSFSEFKRLLRFMNGGSVSDRRPDEGVLELTISKDEANLDVRNMVISDAGKIYLDHLKGIWIFKNRYFKSDARVHFTDQDGTKFGCDLVMADDGSMKSKVWKNESERDSMVWSDGSLR
jgi:hypothetical protein